MLINLTNNQTGFKQNLVIYITSARKNYDNLYDS